MAKKNINTTSLVGYVGDKPVSAEPVARKINPKSLENLQPKQKGRAPQKYMQINVFEHEDYLYRMAKMNGVPITKYVLSIIEKDREANAEVYEALKKIEKFDKPSK